MKKKKKMIVDNPLDTLFVGGRLFLEFLNDPSVLLNLGLSKSTFLFL